MSANKRPRLVREYNNDDPDNIDDTSSSSSSSSLPFQPLSNNKTRTLVVIKYFTRTLFWPSGLADLVAHYDAPDIFTFDSQTMGQDFSTREDAMDLLVHFMRQIATWKGQYPETRPEKSISRTLWSGGQGWSYILQFVPLQIIETRNPDALEGKRGYKDTFLSWSCLCGWTSMVALLLKCGADPNGNTSSSSSSSLNGISTYTASSYYKEGPLHDAIWNLHLPCIRLLLEHGAIPTQNDKALVLRKSDAREVGASEAMMTLLNHPNHKCNSGRGGGI